MKTSIQSFLNTVKSHISFSEAQPEIEQELSRHLEDLTQENLSQGLGHDESVTLALRQMGDPDEIGQRLNQVHTPQIPWVLLFILDAMLFLGIYNAIEMKQFTSHGINILIGVAACLAFIFIKPRKLMKFSGWIFLESIVFLGAAVLWGEHYQGLPYIKFLCFNINAVDFTLAPLLIALAGLIGRRNSSSVKQTYFLTALSALPVLAFALSGSAYASILFAAAALAMLVSASFGLVPVLIAALAYAVTIATNSGPQQFLSAEAFAAARLSEAHTDFVLMHLRETSGYLGILGLFLAMALVAQLGTLLLQVRSTFARTALTGHLTVLTLAMTWSVLANFGYVAMPVSGTPMPFISYGGSFLIGQMALLGLSTGLYRRRTLSLA